MKSGNFNTIIVPFDEYTPHGITTETQKIEKWNGLFERFLETKVYVFFVNESEGDDNENTLMFRKVDLSLVSDNYFASAELFEIALERADEITFLSDAAKEMIAAIQE